MFMGAMKPEMVDVLRNFIRFRLLRG